MRNKHSYIFLNWHVNRMLIAYINELAGILKRHREPIEKHI